MAGEGSSLDELIGQWSAATADICTVRVPSFPSCKGELSAPRTSPLQQPSGAQRTRFPVRLNIPTHQPDAG